MMKHKSIRKTMSLLLSLSLMCALLLACSGCGGNKDKEALIGTWEATVDMTDMINDEMRTGLGSDQELMSYFNISNFSVTFTLSFQDDDSYQLAADEASLEKSVDNVIDTFRDGIQRYFEDMIAQQEVDMTVEEVLEAVGYSSLDQFLEEMFDKDDIMSSMDEMESSGTFEAKDGILYLTDDEGTGLEAYELDGAKLTLTGEGVEDGDLVGLYPLVFNKK